MQAADDKDAQIQKLRAQLAELTGGKRKADEPERETNGGAGGGVNGKRQRKMHSTEPAGEDSSAAGTGRVKLGILDRVQFGSQRGGSGAFNGAAANGGTGNDSREADRYECGSLLTPVF